MSTIEEKKLRVQIRDLKKENEELGKLLKTKLAPKQTYYHHADPTEKLCRFLIDKVHKLQAENDLLKTYSSGS